MSYSQFDNGTFARQDLAGTITRRENFSGTAQEWAKSEKLTQEFLKSRMPYIEGLNDTAAGAAAAAA